MLNAFLELFVISSVVDLLTLFSVLAMLSIPFFAVYYYTVSLFEIVFNLIFSRSLDFHLNRIESRLKMNFYYPTCRYFVIK